MNIKSIASAQGRNYLLLLALLGCTAFQSIPLFINLDPVDLITLYTAGTMVREHADPYIDARLKQRWREIGGRQQVRQDLRGDEPGLPTALLYSPNTLLLYSFVAMAPWKVLPAIMRLLLLVTAALLLVILWRLDNRRNRYSLALFFLAFCGINGVAWIFLVVNPTVFAFFCIALFYWAQKRQQQVLAGLFLGLSMIKVTLTIPFVVFVLFRRQWKTLPAFMICAALPFIYLWAVDPSYAYRLIVSWLHATQDWDRLFYAIFPGGGMRYGKDAWEWRDMLDYGTSLGPLLSFYCGKITGFAPFAVLRAITYSVGLAMLAATIIIDRKRGISNELLCVMLLCIELLINYHLHYDVCLPVLFLLLARGSIPRPWKIALLVAVSPFYLPYNGAMIRLGIPKEYYLWAFNMATPVMAMFAAAAIAAYGKGRSETAIASSQ